MKKLTLMMILILGIGINLLAQDEPIKQEELAAVQVVNAVFDRTTEAVEQLATALKVPAEHVYNILVRQQLINSIQLIITFILLLLLSYFMIRIPYNDWMKTNKDWWEAHKESKEGYYNRDSLDEGWWLWSIVPGAVLMLIVVIAFICSTGDIATGFINPEYGAIKDIMSIL